MKKICLTMSQALVRFLANQYVVMDDVEYRFVHGILGIFGHGNVMGVGEALEFAVHGMTYYQGHNEQGMGHVATAFAKQKNRLGILACTTSIGPGATNMLTAAATATTNRLPLLLLLGDVFSDRQPDPVLQQLEVSSDYTLSVNDCFKPVSKYWDRLTRPEQLMTACMNAFQVITDPKETGTVTLCLPQDVQAESYYYPESFFEKRLWFIDRESVSNRAIMHAINLLKNAQTPLIIAGGGVHYSFATKALAEFALKHGIPVAETQAGKSALPASHPMNVGGIGVTGSEVANSLAKEADVILVIGSRLQDFTTSSKSGFIAGKNQFIHLNVNPFDAIKMNSLVLKGDARCGIEQLSQILSDYQTSLDYQSRVSYLKEKWQSEVNRVCSAASKNGLHQTTLIGLINHFTNENDVIISAAGSLPGDLHRLWQSKQPKDYHLEYAYSCMGYEVAAGLGVRLAKGDSDEVYVLVGDGSFIMLHSELLTSIQEKKKITVIVFNNHGYQCIHQLQAAHGSQGFGNEFRYRDPATNQLTGNYLAIDFCQYAAALGAKTFFADTYDTFQSALCAAKKEQISCLISVPVLANTMSQGYQTWWRVGIAEVSCSAEVNQAYKKMHEQILDLDVYV